MENQEYEVVEKRPDGTFVMAPKRPRMNENVETSANDPLDITDDDLEASVPQMHGRNIF
jgi:hypothetical protein